MKNRFADTFYYIALLSRSDRRHNQALALTDGYEGRMVTTTAVLTELGDGFADTDGRDLFVNLVADLTNDPDVEVVAVDFPRFQQGMELFADRPDKDWSLTDCISFVVMQERGITEALTGDHHFEQAGFTALLK
jgi:predicted nucleic acid-binding protein